MPIIPIIILPLKHRKCQLYQLIVQIKMSSPLEMGVHYPGNFEYFKNVPCCLLKIIFVVALVYII